MVSRANAYPPDRPGRLGKSDRTFAEERKALRQALSDALAREQALLEEVQRSQAAYANLVAAIAQVILVMQVFKRYARSPIPVAIAESLTRLELLIS